MQIDPVHPDTHPTRLVQAARALRSQLRQEGDAVAKAADPERTAAHVETLTKSVVVLTSMVEALALRASRAR